MKDTERQQNPYQVFLNGKDILQEKAVLKEDYYTFTKEDIRTHEPAEGQYEEAVYRMKRIYQALDEATPLGVPLEPEPST